MSGPRTLLSVSVAMLVALVAAIAPVAPVSAQSVDPDEYAARSVARIAHLDLRTRVMPTPDDYFIAAKLLESAAAFQPDDPELLRMRIRAAWSAGDTESVDELTRRLVVLDPGDTVAQLRLASSRIRRLQTVEERLAAYDRLLGPEGARIDASVRSRLALDAALICRERNDLVGFTERLTQATVLDLTNKEAAALAWSYFGPIVPTRSDRLELLLNLLQADPTDPNVHRQIANELALGGAFEHARRFHSRAISLYTALDPTLDQTVALEAAVIAWQLEGPKTVVNSLNNQLLSMRQAAANRIMQWEAARMPTDSLAKPEEVVLEPAYNQMRLVAAIMADDKQTIQATLQDMASVSTELIKQAGQLAQLSTPEEKYQRSLQLWSALAQHLVAIAWADASTEALKDWADRAAASFGEEADYARTLRAWSALRLGDPADAERIFRTFPPEAALNQVGLAMTLEKLDRAAEAHEVLRLLATNYPLSLPGVWARDRYRTETGADPLATPERSSLNRIAASVPAWVDRMTLDPHTFMALQADLIETTLSPTGRPQLRIRITNLAPQPLGVGGDRAINSRLLLSPRLETGTGLEFVKAFPEVVELDRRLRLMPAESIDVVVWPDPGLVGWVAEVGAIETVRERWRVIQGYTLDSGGVPTPGVLCLEYETQSLVRSPLELGRADATELATALEGAPLSSLPEVLAAIRARSLLEPGTPYALAGDDLQRIASIAADRYGHLPPAARAMMLGVLPTAVAAPGMEAFDTAALEEKEPSLVPVVLATRVTRADHPALAAWLGSDSAGLGAFVRAVRTRLEAPKMIYSRLDAGALRASQSVQAGLADGEER